MRDTVTRINIEKQVTWRRLVSPYIIVAKPGIVALVLVATLSGMYMASHGLPGYSLIFWTLFGVGLSTAGAAALNNYIDRDIDLIMRRTRKRPLPSGAVAPGNVLITGLVLSVFSVLVIWWYVNMTTAILTASAILIYVVPYTMFSKRRTPLATFIGGVGGALPPVIGYSAVKPHLDVYALALFLIIFAWQHPHFWSLALKYMNEYKAADVRNLPVVSGVDETKKQITVWAGIMALVSVAPYFLGMSGPYYLAVAIAFGAVHLMMSINFLLSKRKVAMSLFFYSIIQLPALFCVMIIDII